MKFDVMGLARRVFAAWLVVGLVVLSHGASAQGLSGLARLDLAASRVFESGPGVAVDLAISQPVPWRVRVLDAPPRLVVDFREVDFSGFQDAARVRSARVLDLRAGPMRPGWSRLVLELDAPYLVTAAEMRTGDAGALVRLRLEPADQAAFAARAAEPDPDGWRLPRAADTRAARSRQRGEGPLVVVLDPGHGGLDPGAEAGGVSEADLMLQFARELKEALTRAGDVKVVLTREGDDFVPLETRIAVAHGVEADLFVSLHADALVEGQATGATVYTLAEAASDAASAALAERHDRDALLSGVDLTGQDDLIAGILMDMARVETAPRADRLAAALVDGLQAQGVRLHKVPRRGAAFSVLKSPDIPSVLLELGYLSSKGDLARLTDPAWRAKVAAAVVAGIARWRVADAAEASLLRQ